MINWTFPRQPKNRLDFAGGLRFTHTSNQTVFQAGSARRHFQAMMFRKRKPRNSGGVGYLHFSFNGRGYKWVWLRLSTRLSLWMLVVGSWRIPRVSVQRSAQ